MEIYDKKIGELTIPVPWGHIAAKTWGEENDPLILCIHGMMDNASSFDRILPYLPNSFYYVCIDLPGHGRSSHFPPHMHIHTLNYLLVYNLIHKYFQKKFIIMGHSYGGQIGFLFTQVYPECVIKLIMLDTISTFPVSTKHFAPYLSRLVDTHMDLQKKLNSNKPPPTYTKEEALEKLISGRQFAPISREGAAALLERSIELVGDGKYKFSIDHRLKTVMLPIRDFRYIKETIKHHPVRCPVLIVLGTESGSQQVLFSSIIQLLKQKPNIRIKYAEGNHDVHNDRPEQVAPYVKKFLLWQRNKL